MGIIAITAFIGMSTFCGKKILPRLPPTYANLFQLGVMTGALFMDTKYKKRYLTAVYLVLLALSVLFALLGDKLPSPWATFAVNLSTEIMGAVILFFLVNMFFLIEEWDVAERVEEILQTLEHPSAAKFFVNQLPSGTDLRNYIRGSQRVDMCGLTLNSTLHRTLPEIRSCLSRGGRVRMMIVDLSYENLKRAAMRSGEAQDWAHFMEYYKAKLCSSIKTLQNLRASFPNGNIEVRFLPYLPSFGLLKFEFINNFSVSAMIGVEIYPYGMRGFAKMPYFVLERERDGEWFNYFEEQFESLWRNSKDWDKIALEEVKNEFCQGSHDKRREE